MRPATARCGLQLKSDRDGLPIGTATGCGSRPGDGPGLKTNLGDSLPSTTDVGPMWMQDGAGCRVRSTCARCMHRHWSCSLAEERLPSEAGAGVAWFPLAPREVYVPWYRTSPRYVNNVNVTNTNVNVTQVTNVYNTTIINNNTTNVMRINYANQHVNNAVTAVSHETFANARPVAASMVKVDQKQIENAPVVHNIPVQPVRQSVMGAGRAVSVKPPAAVMNRQVVATRQPPPPRAPFGQRPATEPNVRTETPGQPQPAARPSGTQRPQEPATESKLVPHPQVPTPPANNRPATPPPNAARPGTSQPQEPSRQPEPASPAAHPAPRPPAGGGHPLVKPAPPVQENPQHQQNEQAKFNTWQQQRQNSAPRPPAPRAPQPAPHAPQPAPHESKPHK